MGATELVRGWNRCLVSAIIASFGVNEDLGMVSEPRDAMSDGDDITLEYVALP